MSKRCIYCKAEVDEDSVIDFCDACGNRVWGPKMFNTIKKNMEDARENGDLCHTQTFVKSKESGVGEQNNTFSL